VLLRLRAHLALVLALQHSSLISSAARAPARASMRRILQEEQVVRAAAAALAPRLCTTVKQLWRHQLLASMSSPSWQQQQ